MEDRKENLCQDCTFKRFCHKTKRIKKQCDINRNAYLQDQQEECKHRNRIVNANLDCICQDCGKLLDEEELQTIRKQESCKHENIVQKSQLPNGDRVFLCKDCWKELTEQEVKEQLKGTTEETNMQLLMNVLNEVDSIKQYCIKLDIELKELMKWTGMKLKERENENIKRI